MFAAPSSSGPQNQRPGMTAWSRAMGLGTLSLSPGLRPGC